MALGQGWRICYCTTVCLPPNGSLLSNSISFPIILFLRQEVHLPARNSGGMRVNINSVVPLFYFMIITVHHHYLLLLLLLALWGDVDKHMVSW